MFKKNKKSFFANKSCEICGKRANIFRVIENKTYVICDSRKCDFTIRVKHGFHEPLIRK